jgi:hypothetical protein
MSEQEALAASLKVNRAYREVCERILSRNTRYIKAKDRQQLAILNESIRRAVEVLR